MRGVGRREAGQIPRHLGARAPDGPLAWGLVGQQAARQALRAEVDRLLPARPVAARADDDLGGAAADVDDGDRPPGRRRREPDRADEGETTFLGRAQHPNRAARGQRQHLEQVVAVRSLPAGARDQHFELLDACAAGVLGVAGDDLGSLRELALGDASVTLDVRAEPQHLSLREDRPPAAHHEQAHGVRADVDDPNRHASMVTTPHDVAA